MSGRVLSRGLLLGAMTVLLVLSSLGKKLVYDGFDNLAYGYKVLTEGPSVPRNGQRMPLLALNAVPCRAEGCRRVLLDASEGDRLAVRTPTMVFALLLAFAVYGWARELHGPAGGLLALAIAVLDPTLLAHGKEVTSDVPAAFFTLASVWALWRVVSGRGRRPLGLGLAALAATGALLSKYTSLLLAPLLALLLVLDAFRQRREKGLVARRGLEAAILLLLVLLFLNAAYFFRGSFTRADRYEWKSAGLQFLRAVPLPLPLPRVFVLGLDFSAYVQEQPDVGRGNNYVLGRLGTEGVWYAFPLMLLFKTPLALFGLLALSLWRWPRGGTDLAFLLLPPATFLAFFSLLVEPQLGIRYLLPALPFLTVTAAGALPHGGKWPLAILVAWQALSVLSYHPHYMSYFNELIGRRVNAYRYLADSNLDWEDRTQDIARFQVRHPEMKIAVEPAEPRAGYVLVGANKLVGVYEPERYRWLRENFRPVSHVGYSYLLFYVPPERLGDALRRSGSAAPPP